MTATLRVISTHTTDFAMSNPALAAGAGWNLNRARLSAPFARTRTDTPPCITELRILEAQDATTERPRFGLAMVRPNRPMRVVSMLSLPPPDSMLPSLAALRRFEIRHELGRQSTIAIAPDDPQAYLRAHGLYSGGYKLQVSGRLTVHPANFIPSTEEDSILATPDLFKSAIFFNNTETVIDWDKYRLGEVTQLADGSGNYLACILPKDPLDQSAPPRLFCGTRGNMEEAIVTSVKITEVGTHFTAYIDGRWARVSLTGPGKGLSSAISYGEGTEALLSLHSTEPLRRMLFLGEVEEFLGEVEE
ncbi:MAG: hypothetical protein HQM16_15010 [Deltaproteobacteria bacterium]|nr:hypothetical protein [Deltaproteobacteria bacterium]